MSDEKTVEKPKRATRKTAEKVQPVPAAFDKTRDNWGMTFIPESVVEKAEEQENPLLDGMKKIISESNLHNRWISIPLLGKKISKAAAFATAKQWRRVRTIDGERYQFDARVFHLDPAESGQEWAVGVYYDPTRKPAPRSPRKPRKTAETATDNTDEHHTEPVAEPVAETPAPVPAPSPEPVAAEPPDSLKRLAESIGVRDEHQPSFEETMSDLRAQNAPSPAPEPPAKPQSFRPQVYRPRPASEGPRIA